MFLSVINKEISYGKKGTKQTIQEMARLARLAGFDPQWVMFWRGQVADLPSKDYKAEAQRIFDLVKQHVRYVRDPNGLELVQDPRSVFFRDGSGDCDEHCSTIMAAAIALGFDAAARTVGADANRPDEFSHVYAMLGIPDSSQPDGTAWYAADTTQANSYLGWNPPAERIHLIKDWVIT